MAGNGGTQSVVQYMQHWARRVDEKLKAHLPVQPTYPQELHRALHYCVLAPGKRFRPVLMIAVAQALGAVPEGVLTAGAGIEFIHTASLTLDDLPCMDNAKMRRGQKTVHLAFGEDVAVLVATALLVEGLALVSLNAAENGLSQKLSARVVRETAAAVSTMGMAGGQYLDLHAPPPGWDEKTVKIVHARKTSALIVAAVRVAAVLCHAKSRELEALTGFAHKLGSAFQISDDLLDVTGDQTRLGKMTGQDQGKPNLARVIGSAEAGKRLDGDIAEALAHLEGLDTSTDILRSFVRFMRDRQS